jgi:hypothetical protein
MSFFSSTRNVPQPKQKAFNIDERHTSTNEQARPVPYLAGIARLAVTFISDAFNVKSQRVRMRVGKKKETVGYNYFASFAALICHGPLDRLDAIWMDDELVWEGTAQPERHSRRHHHREPGQCPALLGHRDQGQDPLLATSGTVHPAYRGQAYLVFNQLFFGRDRTNAPNIEVLVTRWPNAAWLPTPNSIQDDVNPVIPLWDLWTNPRYGLGPAREPPRPGRRWPLWASGSTPRGSAYRPSSPAPSTSASSWSSSASASTHIRPTTRRGGSAWPWCAIREPSAR